MIQINDSSDCCGCSACASVCNHGAISMVTDPLGFKYPEVDARLCINCGLCEKVCPFREKNRNQTDISVPFAFAVRHKDIGEIKTSRSGAAFIALSDAILDRNGVVYGAGYSNDFQVVHKRAVTKKERDDFKGSKYAQSDLGNVFREVRTDLRAGLKVMFSGTPCQIAGLKSFLGGKMCENLYLVDIICHGVSSPFVWKDYLDYLERKEKDKLIFVNFRDKNIFGWSGLHKESFTFERKGLKTYDYIYYNPYILRKSCNKCMFASIHRPSDITIGDFWGWEKVVPDFNADDKGVSLVLCNSQKGLDLFQLVFPALNVIQVDLQDCLQPNLEAPTPMDVKRNAFEEDYRRYGFEYVMKKYGDIGLKYQIRRGIRFIKRIVKRVMKI